MIGLTPSRSRTANELSHEIITAAMKVHSALGPGLLESTYQACLQHELAKSGIHSHSQVPLPVVYDGVHSMSATVSTSWWRTL
jgi:GxxExxY protein